MSGPDHPFYPERGPGGPSSGWRNCLIFLVVFLVLVAIVAFLVIRSWSDSESGEPPGNLIVPTVPAPTQASPTSTPEPEPAILGERERVWVYADSTIVPQTCFDLVLDMIPASASVSISGKAVECSPGVADYYRADYQRDSNGVLHLMAIELFVVTTPTLPQPFGNEACRDIEPYLLPATQPITDAGFVAVCSWVPPLRGALPRPRIATWSGVVEGSVSPNFPPETPCWKVLPYLGAPRGADTVKERCVIE